MRSGATAAARPNDNLPFDSSEVAPLLPSNDNIEDGHSGSSQSYASKRNSWIYPASEGAFCARLKHFLLSKYAHYMVLILVALDIAGIFADFLISLHVCEHTCGEKIVDDTRSIVFWKNVSKILGVVSLVFSSFFMLELVLSIYAFGIRFFRSMFHLVDAVSIVASFLVDVMERGTVAEAGSLIIALRLFRIFKIIEEGSTAAEAMGPELEERAKMLEEENEGLRRRLMAIPSNHNEDRAENL